MELIDKFNLSKDTKKVSKKEVETRVAQAIKALEESDLVKLDIVTHQKFSKERKEWYKEEVDLNIYIAEKIRSGFHIYRVNKEEGELQELNYNLITREFTYRRNFHKRAVNKTNIDRVLSGYGATGFLIQVAYNEEEEKMWTFLYRRLSCMRNEQVNMINRFLYRMMDYGTLEVLWKLGVPHEFISSVAVSIHDTIANKYFSFEEIKERKTKEELLEIYPLIFGTKPKDIFGVPAVLWKEIVAGNITYSDWDNIRRKKPNINATKEIKKNWDRQLATLVNLVKTVHEFEEQYGIPRIKGILGAESRDILDADEYTYKDYTEEGVLHLQWEENMGISAYAQSQIYNINYTRLIRYLYFELVVDQGFEFLAGSGRSLYRDYLRMSRQTQVEPNKFPKNLKTVHDIVQANLKAIKTELTKEDMEALKNKWADLADFKMKKSVYTLEAPTCLDDIVTEGTRMHHCVASYVPSVAKGLTNILFLRNQVNQRDRGATVEIRNNRIVQARGISNAQVNSEMREFLDKYARTKNISYGSFKRVETPEVG